MAITRVTTDFLATVLGLPEATKITDVEIAAVDDEQIVLTMHLEGYDLEEVPLVEGEEYNLMYEFGHVYGPELTGIEPKEPVSS